ncbi:hypothetical protein [Streptomyces endophytica]|uniref:Uncharacterized protein n=1 Tax=Streptomyces endophytica TaxID=2991496 RepID=A0ABY6PAW1_9ACTN|nr:hypothetical protein [Streptomyces endophytica]UZJ30921.1 hypothetical protein OJ254_11890 [Streptomyces endophytica]
MTHGTHDTPGPHDADDPTGGAPEPDVSESGPTEPPPSLARHLWARLCGARVRVVAVLRRLRAVVPLRRGHAH